MRGNPTNNTNIPTKDSSTNMGTPSHPNSPTITFVESDSYDSSDDTRNQFTRAPEPEKTPQKIASKKALAELRLQEMEALLNAERKALEEKMARQQEDSAKLAEKNEKNLIATRFGIWKAVADDKKTQREAAERQKPPVLMQRREKESTKTEQSCTCTIS